MEQVDPRRFVLADRIVEGLYLSLLGRPVDDEGLRAYAQLITDGVSVETVVLTLVKSDEFKGGLYGFLRRIE